MLARRPNTSGLAGVSRLRARASLRDHAILLRRLHPFAYILALLADNFAATMSALSTPDSYRAHIGTDFLVQLPDGVERSLRLDSVKSGIDDDVQLSFSLLFSCSGELLVQHLYSVKHEHLGNFDLFLVPVQQKRGGPVYEAVFNLLRDDAQ